MSAAQAAVSTLLRPIIQHEADIEFAMGIAETEVITYLVT
jgi:hypothetical protein